MQKTQAIELLGGTVASTASAIGISYQAVDKWPDVLPARIADRVLAAVARSRFPELICAGTQPADEADVSPEDAATEGVSHG